MPRYFLSVRYKDGPQGLAVVVWYLLQNSEKPALLLMAVQNELCNIHDKPQRLKSTMVQSHPLSGR